MTKAITLWQPWATLCVRGLKKYETRPRQTHYRGELIIHASARPVDVKHGSRLDVELVFLLGADWRDTMVLGAGLGTVEIVDALQMTPAWIAKQSRQELLFGDWQSGRWSYELAKPHRWVHPVPRRGLQAIPWTWESRA